MTEPLLIVFAASLIPVPIIVVAILIVALIIFGGAMYARRSSKKNANASSGSASDWQRQAQPGAWNNQQGSASGWGQNAQQAGWNAQGQQNSWSGTPGQGNAPQQNPWGAPAAQPQAQAQQQNPWGAPAAQPQAQAQQQNPWGAASADQNPWGASAAQPQPQAQQQNPWGAPAAQPQAQPQQQNPWGNQGMPSAWGNEAAPAAAPASQDAWGQAPSSGSSQQWGAQPMGNAGNVSQQPNSFAGDASSQSWGQQPQQANPWNAQAPAQQASFGGAANPPSMPSWQQPQAGYGQQPGNMGGQDQTAYYQDDKTVVRPGGGPQPVPTSIGYVRVEEGKEPGRIYEIRKESLSIGRSRESDIFLEDLAVSRLHASIVNLGNGSYALKDEGSANGTKVNGQLVNKFQTYPLQEGDRIQLGQTVLVFARK